VRGVGSIQVLAASLRPPLVGVGKTVMSAGGKSQGIRAVAPRRAVDSFEAPPAKQSKAVEKR
jgi:hypothetical protein